MKGGQLAAGTHGHRADEVSPAAVAASLRRAYRLLL